MSLTRSDSRNQTSVLQKSFVHVADVLTVAQHFSAGIKGKEYLEARGAGDRTRAQMGLSPLKRLD
jgi:hypothetical protein